VCVAIVIVMVVVVCSGGGGAAAVVYIVLLCTHVSMCILINCENNKELFSFMLPILLP